MLTFEAVRAPYPGLRPFEADEADLFFGRERHVDALLKRLSGSHFVAVVGESGAGKSSLVRAGLLPALQAGFVVEAGSDWRVAVMRPGGAPLEALAGALLEPGVLTDAGSAPREEFALAELRRGPLGLVQLVRDAHLGRCCNLLVVVDQFEEVFRYCREPAQKDQADIFVELILRAADQRKVPIFVVLTMRSDFVGDCARFRGLPETLNDNQYLTPRLTRDQIAAAIREPARVCGGMVDPALVDELCNAVGDNPDQLPLLQHLMMRVWDRASEHSMPPRLTGDIAVKLGGLYSALNHHAQHVYEALREEQKPIARAMFKRLTDPLSQRRDLRRDALVSDIAAVAAVDAPAVIGVADAFRATGRHMLMPPPAVPLDPGSRLDISHESLIRQWVTLDAWAREENVSAREFLRLRNEALEELQGQADPLTGRDLTRALDWMRQAEPTPAWAARYSEPGELETTVTFIKRSAAEAQKRKDDQAQLVAREAAAKRQRLVSWLSVGGLVLASIVAGVVLYLYSEARTQRDEAKKGRKDAETAQGAANQAKEEAFNAAREARTNEEIAAKQRQLAIDESEEAAEARGQAHSRQLAADARIETQNDPALAVLLASAAVNEENNDVQALGALRGALTAHVPNLESPFAVAKSRHYVPDSQKNLWLDFSLNDASVSSHGSLAVVPSSDKAIIWSLATGRELLPRLEGHSGIVGAARFSPDGRFIATSSQDKTARVWDVSTHKEIAVLVGHTKMLNDVVFSPDSKLLITLGDDGFAKVWTVESYAAPLCALETKSKGGNFLSASFSHDRQHLVTVTHVSPRWYAEVWNIAGGICSAKVERTFELSTGLKWATFSPFGPWLGIVRTDGEVSILNVSPSAADWPGTVTLAAVQKGSAREEDDEESADEGGRRRDYPPPLAWSADGRYFAAAGTDHVVRVTTVDRLSVIIPLRGHTRRITSLSFHPSDNVLLSTSVDGTARLWKLGEDARLIDVLVLKGHKDRVGSGVFASNGSTVLTASDDSRVRAWEPRWTLLERPLPGARSFAFSQDGRRLWVGWTTTRGARRQSDSRAGEFEVATLKPTMEPLTLAGTVLFAGTYLLNRQTTDEVTVRNARGGAAIPIAGSRKMSLTSTRTSPDGRFLLAALDDDGLGMWDLAAPARLPDRIKAQSGCEVAAVSNDQRIAWSCSEGDRLLISRGGQPGFTIQTPDKATATAMTFSTNGRLLAVNFEDRSVRLFDTRSGKPTLELRGHDEPVLHLAFSSDDRLLLGIGNIRSRIWGVPAGDRVAVLPPAIRGADIDVAALSPDGRSLAFASPTRLLIWRCEACGNKDALLDEARRHKIARTLSPEEMRRYGLNERGVADLEDHGDAHVGLTVPPQPLAAPTTGSKPH